LITINRKDTIRWLTNYNKSWRKNKKNVRRSN